MDELIPGLVIFYLLVSVASAFYKRLTREPVQGEFGEADTVSEYQSMSPVNREAHPATTAPTPPALRPATVGSRLTNRYDSDELEEEAPEPRTQGRRSSLSRQTSVQAGTPSPIESRTAAAAIRSMLAQPGGVRQAMILREVIGPPKSLRRGPGQLRR